VYGNDIVPILLSHGSEGLISENTGICDQDIYMTELDRIFRHFRARDIINAQASAGEKRDWLALDTTDGWIGSNFQPGTYKNNRRLLFFPEGEPPKPWGVSAGADPDAFADEQQRADNARTDRSTQARARRAANGGAGGSTEAPVAKKTATKKAISKTKKRRRS